MTIIAKSGIGGKYAAAAHRLPLLLSGVFILTAYLLLILYSGTEEVKTLSVVFCSIMFEAAPFMLLGSLIGGIIEAFVSRDRLLSCIPRGRFLPVLLAAGLGLVLPVCECAIVPVVHRLCRKGLPPAAAIAYLLGGPAVNPVVAFSTALAYQFDWRIAGIRLVLGYVIAVVVALVVQRFIPPERVLLADVADGGSESGHVCGNHVHESGHPGDVSEHKHTGTCGCSCVHEHGGYDSGFVQKLRHSIQHASDDFFAAGHYLVIGAFIAALAQTFVNREFFISFSEFPLLPGIMMMCLAILLNLCSETDAFIVASMRGLLPVSAQLAFMLTGPIFDLKLLLMYQRIFRRRTIIVLVAAILLVVFCIATGLELLEGWL